jgi:hypothetical protein
MISETISANNTAVGWKAHFIIASERWEARTAAVQRIFNSSCAAARASKRRPISFFVCAGNNSESQKCPNQDSR